RGDSRCPYETSEPTPGGGVGYAESGTRGSLGVVAAHAPPPAVLPEPHYFVQLDVVAALGQRHARVCVDDSCRHCHGIRDANVRYWTWLPAVQGFSTSHTHRGPRSRSVRLCRRGRGGLLSGSGCSAGCAYR